MEKGFLPNRGNYKELLSYDKSLLIYDCNYIFCDRFIDKYDRTRDQMIQAARSGKQNILEGSKASLTSAEMEIKLTNVARASLEELLEDYRDFIRTRNLQFWDKNSKEASYVRTLGNNRTNRTNETNIHESYSSHKSYQMFVNFLKTRDPEVCANIMICIISQCNFLLDRQIKSLENTFLEKGGLKETMYNARKKYRNG